MWQLPIVVPCSVSEKFVPFIPEFGSTPAVAVKPVRVVAVVKMYSLNGKEHVPPAQVCEGTEPFAALGTKLTFRPIGKETVCPE